MARINMNKIALTAILSLGAASGHAQDDDILSRYRAQGGMLPMESGGAAGQQAGTERSMASQLATGTEMTPEKVDGFNQAVEEAFAMTPDMIRRYREIMEANERAAQERPAPKEEISTRLVSLQPGEPAPTLTVSPNIASVIGFYDASGASWPIEQYILGNSENFTAVHLGEAANNIILTPNARIGFTNLVVKLEGQDKPLSVRVKISEDIADYRFDVQVMKLGPNAQVNNASGQMNQTVTEAGSGLLLKALDGAGLPEEARVDVVGVNARAWLVDGRLLLRSPHALYSPGWIASMSGPDGVRVYEIEPAYTALFSVNGQTVRADIKLP